MDNFKVSLESLYTNKIKEINFDEEEAYQEKPTLSQRLIELAQRVDFSDRTGTEHSEIPPKKAVQQWPWQQANSKLRMALTEVSVLSDVIQIVQHQQKYVALNQVVVPPTTTITPAYQHVVKKKALSVGAGILRKGVDSLSVSLTDREREFHRAIALLRQRWRLKRVGSGMIVGDLSYRSAGSLYASSVNFDVCKSTVKATASSAPSGMTAEPARSDVNVTVPRVLRGVSEILVFLSSEPVQDMPPLSSFPCPLSPSQLAQHRGGGLSSVELQLTQAQNVLFNQELFSQLAKEAYDQKMSLQHKVSTNTLHIPLSLDCWLSVLHVHECDHTPPPLASASSLPVPRWDLVVALKQLLRESHRQRATLVVSRPSTMGFQELPEIWKAGIIPIKGRELKESVKVKKNLFNQFLDKAKHLYNEERLQQWLKELCSCSVDPALQLTWAPHPSFSTITALLHLKDTLHTSSSFSVKVVLKVDKVTVERGEECGGDLTFPFQQEKLLLVLKHQIVFLHMSSALKLAQEHGWYVTRAMPRPHLSSTLAKDQENYSGSCSLLLESSNAQVRLEMLFSWNDLSVGMSTCKEVVASSSAEEAGMSRLQWSTMEMQELLGNTFRDKFVHLLTSF